ncbi:hypothetical protein CHCC5027_3538 [Bacillus paralicheniformis]|uniref:sigma-70 family RNA polymerase sigma factor n=1 Tax=Bacillus paralicheniformis TaxID=1648923 RepID=UPI0011A33B4A|nr:sigma-70 family RNA polymerase sigma factor [Bacillus paralicheniformis]TWJ39625.1 hypothetical protein CHCC5027_3538 [Bacillus paralicheniformis]
MSQSTKLPDNKVQRLMKEAQRGVAPLKHNQETDLALIEAYKNGNEEAGWELAESYVDVFSVIMNKPTKPPRRTKAMQRLWADPTYQDYEDLFQEILYHFFRLVEEDNTNKTPFSYYIRAKLHQRVFNNFFSEFIETKKVEVEYDERKHSETVEEDIFLDEYSEKPPAHYLELYNALNHLTTKQRQVVVLKKSKGWSSREVAEELGISQDAVRKQLERGMKKLRKAMDKSIT